MFMTWIISPCLRSSSSCCGGAVERADPTRTEASWSGRSSAESRPSACSQQAWDQFSPGDVCQGNTSSHVAQTQWWMHNGSVFMMYAWHITVDSGLYYCSQHRHAKFIICFILVSGCRRCVQWTAGFVRAFSHGDQGSRLYWRHPETH